MLIYDTRLHQHRKVQFCMLNKLLFVSVLSVASSHLLRIFHVMNRFYKGNPKDRNAYIIMLIKNLSLRYHFKTKKPREKIHHKHLYSYKNNIFQR